MSYTFSIIKPDAVANGHTESILRRISNSGFNILGINHHQITDDEAKKFYEVHKGKPFYESLIDFMTSGRSVVLALQSNSDSTVEDFRDLIGDTDPTKAESGTIRNLYGSEIGKNAIHGSDSNENAINEISFFFPELISKTGI